MAWVDHKNPFLCHHGIKGQKWGVRRFQNSDGSLTAAGKERYEKKMNSQHELNAKTAANSFNKTLRSLEKRENAILNEVTKSPEDDIVRKKANNELIALKEERIETYKKFINDFELSNNVNIVHFQPKSDRLEFSYTDGKKTYSMYKGDKYEGLSDMTGKKPYPNNVQAIIEGLQEEIDDWKSRGKSS